jgi:hypothetical protein
MRLGLGKLAQKITHKGGVNMLDNEEGGRDIAAYRARNFVHGDVRDDLNRPVVEELDYV